MPQTKFISVCKNVIMANNKTRRENLDRPIQPPIRIQRGKSGPKVTCNEANLVVDGKTVGRIYYREDAIIAAGAKVVIEFYGDIELVS